MELETINKLYLELSQITTATTAREILLQKQLAEAQRDAERYRCWRDAMIEDVGLQFTKAVSRALPDAVGVSRRPTAHEWDAAIDAAKGEPS